MDFNLKRLAVLSLLLALVGAVRAADRFVLFAPSAQTVRMTSGNSSVNICLDSTENVGVRIAARNLAADINRATGVTPNLQCKAAFDIVVGTHGCSPLVDRLEKQGVVRAADLKGKNEKYVIVVEQNRIVIAGSDRRGTIYGIYELAEQLGVSPWNWWADVPVTKHTAVYLKKGHYTDGEPAVRYRGVFINDEAPCLTSWVKNTYGTDYGDHRFYARVCELILRLRGNLLWPAMWGWAFYADDPLNAQTADDMGVVIGTSHHEPMARNHQEWARHRQEYGAWNYAKNQPVIDRFFRQGVERMGKKETIVTIGMRGDGDEAMSKDTDTKLLKKVIDNQRKIIAQTTHRPAAETPQVWALYKEVLDYYDAGLRVPDDVIMLLCDDNWGHVRRLPSAAERKHKGGWGMYYHVDYVGAPRNSKWLCNTPVQNMWEQLTLTYDYGVDRLWILNVGDIKPMEYSISEFMDLAWNPHAYRADNLLEHTRRWCALQFGDEAGDEAAAILNAALKYNGRVTAEMLDADTYDLASGEWDKVVNQYRELELRSMRLFMEKIDDAHRDAYRQLILFPVQAMANLYEMYYAQAMNHALYADENPMANEYADRVERCFRRDAELMRQYNHDIAGGKWNGMMTQKHIGYTSWNDNFPADVVPSVKRVGVVTHDGAGQANQGGWTFTADGGLLSVEAEHYFKASAPESAKASWTVIPYMGRTLSGVAVMPYTEPVGGASLAYRFRLAGLPDGNSLSDSLHLTVVVKSNLAFARREGHRYAVSIDGCAEQVVNYNANLNENPENIYSVYYPTVARRVVTNGVSFPSGILKDGSDIHTLTVRPLDPGIVFEKFVLDFTGMHRPVCLGYDESPCRK